MDTSDDPITLGILAVGAFAATDGFGMMGGDKKKKQRSPDDGPTAQGRG